MVCVLSLGGPAGLAQEALPPEAPFVLPPRETNPWARPSLNFYGVPGLIDMPGAHQAPDADLATTIGGLSSTAKITAHFQFTERLSGVFRYSYVDDLFGTGAYYDRSFDLRYQIAQETDYMPAVTIGLQDFGGTGIFAGEYIVAGKTFGPLRATAGLGWGRFGSYNGFTNPIAGWEERSSRGGGGETGQLDTDDWFRGDMAFFGGLEYQANDRLRFVLEYSSDDYTLEQEGFDFPRETPINVGLNYALREDMHLRLAYLYGANLGAQFTYVFNPKEPSRAPRASGPGPFPVALRAPGAAADLGWTQQPGGTEILRDNIAQLLEDDGLRLETLTLRATSATLEIRNGTMSEAQAVGRTARVLTRTLPASIETFEIVPLNANGQRLSRITLQRSDIEELAHDPDGAWKSFSRATIEDSEQPGIGADVIGRATGSAVPNFSWGLGPYLEASFFDPDSPLRLDFGVQARARWEPVSGLILAGQVRQRLAGNRADLRPSDSVLPRVRSEGGRYAEEGETAITRLTIAQYFRPAPEVYGRVTFGYLERMHAGLSTELLWKPVDSPLALGAEVNYSAQRDFDGGFGLQDYEVATGHLSAYYKTSGDYHYQVDVGRYLAGDWGSTLTINREFANGTRIGVFATLTDVPFEDFGEGSFDKGFIINIPVSALTGQRSGARLSRAIRPVTRDGGARLYVPGRLYSTVRSWHQPELQDQWGRFWR